MATILKDERTVSVGAAALSDLMDLALIAHDRVEFNDPALANALVGAVAATRESLEWD